MSSRTLNWAVLAAVLAILALVLIPTVAMAKKPPAPPPPPPPSDPDPAIAYLQLDDGAHKLMVMNADGSNQTTVVNVGSAALTRADWSPDGTKLVFGSDLNGNPGVYVVNLDGTGLTRIASTERVLPPVWSPETVPGVGGDEYRIAYRDRDGPDATWEVDLFLVTPDGTDTVRLNDFPDDGSDPTWSPDGTRLAFAELNTRGLYCVLEFGASAYTYGDLQFTGTLAEERPYALSWAKTVANDDKLLCHIITGDLQRDIYVIDLDTPTTATELTSQRGMERFPNYSPDDSRIVFEALANKKASPKIAVMNADGSNITTIQTGGKEPTWKR